MLSPKSEIRNPKEGRNPKSECSNAASFSPAEATVFISLHPWLSYFRFDPATAARRIRISAFGFLSDFGFRISDFVS